MSETATSRMAGVSMGLLISDEADGVALRPVRSRIEGLGGRGAVPQKARWPWCGGGAVALAIDTHNNSLDILHTHTHLVLWEDQLISCGCLGNYKVC